MDEIISTGVRRERLRPENSNQGQLIWKGFHYKTIVNQIITAKRKRNPEDKQQ